MPDAIETITVAGYGLTLSKIVWRRFRKPMPGVVEKTLNATPGLSAKGPILPLGTVINLVVPGEAPTTPSRAVVRLWGSSG